MTRWLRANFFLMACGLFRRKGGGIQKHTHWGRREPVIQHIAQLVDPDVDSAVQYSLQGESTRS